MFHRRSATSNSLFSFRNSANSTASSSSIFLYCILQWINQYPSITNQSHGRLASRGTSSSMLMLQEQKLEYNTNTNTLTHKQDLLRQGLVLEHQFVHICPLDRLLLVDLTIANVHVQYIRLIKMISRQRRHIWDMAIQVQLTWSISWEQISFCWAWSISFQDQSYPQGSSPLISNAISLLPDTVNDRESGVGLL